MAMTDRQVLRALRRLFRIVEAGERGFATAAINANSPGLKLLFKSFAQQRAQFKAEILAELRRLGGDLNPRPSILGMIHRGRVAIFAAMTIEDDSRERVVLKEAAFGERYAARTYQKTLEADLPPETREIVIRQYDEVRKVIEQINLMLGKEGRGLVVRLFDTEEDAETAVRSLVRAGVPNHAIDKVSLDKSIAQYHARGTTVLETILSGVFGGTLWGTLIGVLAGIGAVQTSISEWIGINSVLGQWALVTVVTILLAAIVGGIIGLVIGFAISEDDTYVYQQSILPGRFLVSAVVDSAKANETGHILDQIINQSKEPAVRVSV